jgi:uncharacterized protein YndB with AHSA1/START domain
MTKTSDSAEAIIVERIFDARVGRVWTVLTDVNEMRQWYFDLKEFKAEIGCEFEFVVEHEGNTYHHLCKVTEVIPQRKSLTPGDTKASREILSSRLNYFPRAIRRD